MNDAIELVPLWLALKVAGFATLIAFRIDCGVAFFLARLAGGDIRFLLDVYLGGCSNCSRHR